MAFQDALSGESRNAYEALNQKFSEFGLQSLAPKIFEFVQKGYAADTISILLQDTPEYKQRFSGNEARRKAGLPVLSPAEYLSTESSYRQIMRQAGLPAGFYDQPEDFAGYISKDVSPTEIKQRVDLATQNSMLANKATKDALYGMYGIDQEHLTAYFLDPERATPLLVKQSQAAALGGEALKRGLQADVNHLEGYATAGVTASQAAQAYGQIAYEMPQYQQIGNQYNEGVSQYEMERALLEGNSLAQPGEPGYSTETPQAKLDRLASWNRGRSKGQAGAAGAGLAKITSGMV